jgi:hypothetical protein
MTTIATTKQQPTATNPPYRICRDDALPEHMDYPDTGCDLNPSCLTCPLPRCKYDVGGNRGVATRKRDREIVLLHRKYGAPSPLLARTYGISERSVFRILRAAQPPEERRPYRRKAP